MLSGFGNTTLINAATDAANAFRVCHIGNLFTKYKSINRCFGMTSVFKYHCKLIANMAAAHGLGGVYGCDKERYVCKSA